MARQPAGPGSAKARQVAAGLRTSGPGRPAPLAARPGAGDTFRRKMRERAPVVAPKREDDGGLFDGLKDFYDDTISPVLGRAFFKAYDDAKNTYGVSLVPGIGQTLAAARETDAADEVDEAFDYGADIARASFGVVRDKGWEPTKKHIGPVLEKGARIAGKSVDAFQKAQDDFAKWSESNVPGVEITTRWAEKNIEKPAKDFVVSKYDSVFNSDLEKRLERATPREREALFRSNDLAMDKESEVMSAFSPAERESLVRKALGETGDPFWDDRPATDFTRQELEGMTDNELINAAYKTHTNFLGQALEGIKSDFGKIAAMPAAFQQLDDMIYQAKDEGDYRGLGKMVEFIGKQSLYVPYAIANANVWAVTGGKAGSYEPLVRALETEPLLTTLDALSTVAVAGKAATVPLKTGTAARGIARLGQAAEGSRRARLAGALEETRAAAKGAPIIARPPTAQLVERPVIRVPGTNEGVDLERVAELGGEAEAADVLVPLGSGGVRVFQPRGGLGSIIASQGRKKLYESPSGAGAAYRKWIDMRDATSARALISHVTNVTNDARVQPIVEAFNKIAAEDPDVLVLVMYDLMGLRNVDIGKGIEGVREVVDLSPTEQIARLDMVLDGKLWRRETAKTDQNPEGAYAFRYSDEQPEGEGWQRVELDDNERSVLKINQEFLRRAEQADPAKVARAREVLDTEYAANFGEASGQRRLVGFRGRRAPEGTLRDYIQNVERENIARLTAMGGRFDPRIADLPGGLEDVARQQLGLTPLAGAGERVSRRATGLAAVARLQDPAVAAAQAGPEGARIRGALEGVLRGDLEETASATEKLSKSERLAEQRLARERKKIREETARLKEERKAAQQALDKLKNKTGPKGQSLSEKIAQADTEIARLAEKGKAQTARRTKGRKSAKQQQAEYEARQKQVETVLADIDLYVESKIRDFIEESARPTGGSAFFPTIGGARGAKLSPVPGEATAGRLAPRALQDVHAAQFALVGDVADIEKFGAALARNLKLPGVAYDFVLNLNRLLMREGIVVRFSADKDIYDQQAAELSELSLINGNGEIPPHVAYVINDRTGFFDPDKFARIDKKAIEEAASAGADGVGVDAPALSRIMNEALDENGITNFRGDEAFGELNGKTVVIVPEYFMERIKREVAAAAQGPGPLERVARGWVRLALSTLPRTPIANVIGSAVLSGLGGGLRGYPEALRLLQAGDTPAELINTGLAGATGTEFMIRVGAKPGGNVLRQVAGNTQRYMDWIYSYNVIGEDLARLSVFAAYVQKELRRNPALRAQIQKELDIAKEMTEDANALLAYVARGQFRPDAAPEILALRDRGLKRATDFLGGRVGLTRTTRQITKFVPFYSWLSHILKLYLYTMPLNYPGRSLFLNGMARMGAEQQRQTGMLDTFYRDAIILGYETTPQGNVLAKGFRTNIAPFSFGDLAENEGAFPFAEFVGSAITPVISTPFRIAGGTIPGTLPLRTPSGAPVETTQERLEAGLGELEALVSPLGLLQRSTTPNASLLLSILRGDIPDIEPRGEGAAYETIPRNLLSGAPGAVLQAGLGALGVTPIKRPVRGPVALRRIQSKEKYERRKAIEGKLK